MRAHARAPRERESAGERERGRALAWASEAEPSVFSSARLPNMQQVVAPHSPPHHPPPAPQRQSVRALDAALDSCLLPQRFSHIVIRTISLK